jgi:hypothetical protein
MANLPLTKKDKEQLVMEGITLKDLIRVINGTNEFLKLHKGVVGVSEEQKLLREKMYRASNLASSMIIVGLSKTYCEFAHTLNGMNPEHVDQRLKRDFELANK